eukprot:COSAG02_NODE_166_length_31947_cov_34.168617_21_plen_73_part_00
MAQQLTLDRIAAYCPMQNDCGDAENDAGPWNGVFGQLMFFERGIEMTNLLIPGYGRSELACRHHLQIESFNI